MAALAGRGFLSKLLLRLEGRTSFSGACKDWQPSDWSGQVVGSKPDVRLGPCQKWAQGTSRKSGRNRWTFERFRKGPLPEGRISESRDTMRLPLEWRERRAVQRLAQPAFGMLQGIWRGHLLLGDGLEARAPIKARITVSDRDFDRDFDPFLPKRFDAVGDQSLPDALVLSVGRHRNGAEDKHPTLVTRVVEP